MTIGLKIKIIKNGNKKIVLKIIEKVNFLSM
jgi:hypothetical protein